MVNQQQIIDLAILVLSFYFLAGGVLNMDWALKYRSGRVPEGLSRIVIRIVAPGAGIILLLGVVSRHR